VRSLRQTALEDLSPPSPELLFELQEAALEICHRYDAYLGPLCAEYQGARTVHRLSGVRATRAANDTVPLRDRGESSTQPHDGYPLDTDHRRTGEPGLPPDAHDVSDPADGGFWVNIGGDKRIVEQG
jgi:hypothetical protein